VNFTKNYTLLYLYLLPLHHDGGCNNAHISKKKFYATVTCLFIKLKSLAYVGDLVDGSVCAEAEVRSWNVVANRCWDHGHRNTELGICVSQLSHHQDTVERLHTHTHTCHSHWPSIRTAKKFNRTSAQIHTIFTAIF